MSRRPLRTSSAQPAAASYVTGTSQVRLLGVQSDMSAHARPSPSATTHSPPAGAAASAASRSAAHAAAAPRAASMPLQAQPRRPPAPRRTALLARPPARTTAPAHCHCICGPRLPGAVARALPQVRGALPEQDVSGVGHRQMCEVLVPRCWALKKRVARCLEHSGLVRRSNRSSRLACRLVALICAQGPAPAPAREVLDQFEFW